MTVKEKYRQLEERYQEAVQKYLQDPSEENKASMNACLKKRNDLTHDLLKDEPNYFNPFKIYD